jgi:hypothetical protein
LLTEYPVQGLSMPNLAFPNDEDAPPLILQLLPDGAISLLIPIQLLLPEVRV